MKLCTVTTMNGLDNKLHFAVVEIGAPHWPLALCGLVGGRLAKDSEAQAKLFADAPAILDILEVLAGEFGNINPRFPLAAGKMAELATLAERAAGMVSKHRKQKTRRAA